MTRVAQLLPGGLLLLAGLALGPAAPADAHGGLSDAMPGPGTTVATAPTRVQLGFGVPTVPDGRTRISVTGPSGREVAVGQVLSSGLGTVREVGPLREPGRYRVRYAAVSVDGHVIEGSYGFRFRPGPPAGSGVPGSPLLAGAGAVAATGAAAAAVAVARRRTPGTRGV